MKNFLSRPVVAAALFTVTAVAFGMAAVSPAPAHARASAAAQSWYGEYGYEEMVPRAGGVTGSIDYGLKLDDSGCTLHAEGVMTNETMLCTARMQGNSLVIRFRSFADGKIKNQYGVTVHKPGETLFTLTRSPRGLITRWQGYTPSDGKRRTGRYFTKR